jgi:hypothetical protein
MRALRHSSRGGFQPVEATGASISWLKASAGDVQLSVRPGRPFSFVDGHGGHIWIAASGNVGTTVAFTLPAGPEPESSDGEAPEPDGGIEATAHQRGGHHRQSRHAA